MNFFALNLEENLICDFVPVWAQPRGSTRKKKEIKRRSQHAVHVARLKVRFDWAYFSIGGLDIASALHGGDVKPRA